MDSLKLIRPDDSFKEQWENAIKLLMETDGKIIPNNLAADCFARFLERVDELASGKNLPNGYVTSELYFLISEQDPAVILGATDLRLGTTYDIEQYFGHAGGCILPPYRKQGLGDQIIRLTLELFRKKEFESIILTCEDWNKASRRNILNNGGEFIGNSSFGNKKYERYRINL